MEQWIEVNLSAAISSQNAILLNVLWPYVRRLRMRGVLVTWHFFREPEIRFRIRLRNRKAKLIETRTIAAIAGSLQEQNLITEWHFGNHGERGRPYVGEADRYGRKGWKIAQDYFNSGAEIALRLLALKLKGALENPLWARGIGNPWEGGKSNPWRERQSDPLIYHWSRYVHLFTNQLGFDMDDEAKLCSKQATRYLMVSKRLGIHW